MLNTKAQLGSYGLGILKDLLVACMIVLFVVMSSSLVTAGDEITRVSLSSLGVEGNGISESPAFSADGRYVAFSSAATNLVSGDTNGKWDVFWKFHSKGKPGGEAFFSDAFKNLIENLFEYDPKKRFTME